MATVFNIELPRTVIVYVSYKLIVRRTTPVPPSTTQFFEGKRGFVASLTISEYRSKIVHNCTESTLGHAKFAIYIQYNVQNCPTSVLEVIKLEYFSNSK